MVTAAAMRFGCCALCIVIGLFGGVLLDTVLVDVIFMYGGILIF